MRRTLRHPCSTLQTAACCGVLLGVLALPALAQFGQNKVNYRSFDWRVLETEHFSIHFHVTERETARQAAAMAERGYTYLSEFFDHQFQDKIPLVLHSDHGAFEQSNIIPGLVSESTGGVTESMKGRVSLPITGSMRELNHVLVHELVHAFQFDIGKHRPAGVRWTNQPLWVMEGMAEWVSHGIDPITAMWVLDAQRHDELPTAHALAFTRDIRVYRMGQALFQVIADNYGPDRVRRILSPTPRRAQHAELADSTRVVLPPDGPALRASRETGTPFWDENSQDGRTLDELWTAYADSLLDALGSDLVPPDSVAEVITRGEEYGRSFHLAPTLSSDGNRVLYYTSRGISNELFVATRMEDGWERHALVQGERTAELEQLPLLSASADWAPDGRSVVFVSTRGGHDDLSIFDTQRGKITRRFETHLFSVGNPSFSPDGKRIVFSALSGGREDLFLIDVASGELTQLTHDAYSERTPRFSPDGKCILFATDRGSATHFDDLLAGPWNIAVLELVAASDALMSQDGGSSDLRAGDVSLLVDTPANDFAPVWSPDGDAFAFVSDRTGTHQVHSYDFATGLTQRRTRFASGVVGIVPTGPAFSWSASGHLAYSVFDNGGWHLYRTFGFPEDLPGGVDAPGLQWTHSHPAPVFAEAASRAETTEHGYAARLTPDALFIGSLSFGTGGGYASGEMILGDMLANHFVYIGGGVSSRFEQTEGIVQYLNTGGRWQWGLAGYRFSDLYTTRASPAFVLQTYAVRHGLSGQVRYPFNRFRRVELSMGVETTDGPSGSLLFFGGQPTQVRRFWYGVPGLALVQDNSAYSGFTPVAGGRWRVSASQALGNLNYGYASLDWRRYLNVAMRGALALRLASAATFGNQPLVLYSGGPFSFRGADYNEIVSTRFTLSSVEARFPILPWSESLRGVVFTDAVVAWNGQAIGEQPVWTAFGAGVRLFVGFPLRLDHAFTEFGRGSRTHFSIGFDF